MIYGYLRRLYDVLKLGIYFGLDENNDYRWTIWSESVLNYHMTEDFVITKLDKSKGYLVDVTECIAGRRKVQKYKGNTILKEENPKKIVYVVFDKDSIHDFTLVKDGTQNIDKDIPMLGDSDYQGLDKILINTLTSKKTKVSSIY